MNPQNEKKKFTAIAQPLIEKFKIHKVQPSSIVLREMPTRWGSCTSKGKIILNPELIKAPKGCTSIFPVRATPSSALPVTFRPSPVEIAVLKL